MFQLSDESKLKMKEVLDLQRLVAVKYSFPPSVDGRYPFHDCVQLAKRVPSYLYLAMESPMINVNDQLNSIQLRENPKALGIYKRLITPRTDCTCPKTTCPLTRLCDGKVGAIMYLNTLGGS